MLPFKSDKIKFLSVFFAVLFSALSINAQNPGQTDKETEVPILKSIDWGNVRCRVRKNIVIPDEQKFKEFIAEADCSSAKISEIDFTKQTLIVYNVLGDCMVSAVAKVFRNDSEKKYTVRIKKILGGCRAAGSSQEWLVIERIPPGYTTEFVEIQIDGYGKLLEDGDDSQNSRKMQNSQILETREVNLRGCIQTIFDKEFIIKDRENFLKAVRNDASRDWCLKNLEKIDFDRYTLVGIELNTGYCRVPLGLTSQAVKNDMEKQYILKISYIEPQGLCRALSQYDLWVLVPKLPENYTVKFEVKGKPRSETNQ